MTDETSSIHKNIDYKRIAFVTLFTASTESESIIPVPYWLTLLHFLCILIQS